MGKLLEELAEPILGEITNTLSQKAKDLGVYIIGNLLEKGGDGKL